MSMSDRLAIPVILDTDIGGDIDDTWAMVMMLLSPELDVKLIVSDTFDTEYRAKIIARLLEVAGRTDVPVGIGIRQPTVPGQDTQQAWVEGYQLSRYRGKVHEDGVAAIIETIMNSPRPVTLMCIGPVPNIREAIRREPRIVQRARFVGMHGSIDRNHNGKAGPIVEYNVQIDIPSAQAALSAPWDVTITPLDTCGVIRLTGEKYQAIRRSTQPLAQAIMENYEVWLKRVNYEHAGQLETQSSILFDTVAIHLAYSTQWLEMQDLAISVRDDGMMVRDPKARKMHVAMNWTDLPAYEDDLVARLLGKRM